MHFNVRPFSVDHKFLDTSFLASDYSDVPSNVGFRAQTLKMRFVSSKMKSAFLNPSLNFRDVIPAAEKKATLRSGNYHNAFIGEAVSMIYSPVYVNNKMLYDGILDRPITGMTEHLEEKLKDDTVKNKWDIKFISALCPDCGADLEGARSSVVLLCRNCSSAWDASGGSLRKVEFHSVMSKESNVLNLPFWKMSVDVSGLKLSSFADLIRTANLPRAVIRKLEEKRLYFYSPAFHIHPKIFIRVSGQMTVIQPEEKYREEFAKSDLCPVSINDKEAFETVKITLAHITAAKRKLYPMLPGIEIKAKKAELVYIPFKIRANEYINEKSGFGIQRNAIRNL